MKATYAAVWTPILQLRFWLELAMAIVLLLVIVITVMRMRNKTETRFYIIPALVGIFSLMMGNLYTVVMIGCQHDILGAFTPAILGRLGGMACMFLATQQSLYAAGKKPVYNTASNVISVAVSVVVCAVSLYFLTSYAGYLASGIIYSIEVVLLSLGVFFNLRFALAPIDSELSKSIRPLNFNFAVYSIFSIVYIVLVFCIYDNIDLEYPLIAATVLSMGALLNMPFNLTRGLK